MRLVSHGPLDVLIDRLQRADLDLDVSWLEPRVAWVGGVEGLLQEVSEGAGQRRADWSLRVEAAVERGQYPFMGSVVNDIGRPGGRRGLIRYLDRTLDRMPQGRTLRLQDRACL